MMPAGTDISSLRRRLVAQGVRTRAAYVAPEIVRRNAPVAAATAARLLEVPSHSRMTLSEIRAICGTLSACMDRTTY
jgi:dTDP-4-amino-4,6-dideoxygalactose transaminase